MHIFQNATQNYFLVISDTSVCQLVRKISNMPPNLMKKSSCFLPITTVCLEHELSSHLPGRVIHFSGHIISSKQGILGLPSLLHYERTL